MTLKISLRDGEKIIINGAVLQSIGRSDLCVENRSTILRGREVMAEAEATTPARQLYFACMLAYIDPGDVTLHQDRILVRLKDLITALESIEAKAMCVSFAQRVARSDFYRALSDCRHLIEYETAALAHPKPLSALGLQ